MEKTANNTTANEIQKINENIAKMQRQLAEYNSTKNKLKRKLEYYKKRLISLQNEQKYIEKLDNEEIKRMIKEYALIDSASNTYYMINFNDDENLNYKNYAQWLYLYKIYDFDEDDDVKFWLITDLDDEIDDTEFIIENIKNEIN